MKRRLFLATLLACAAVSGTRASALGQKSNAQPQEQHVIASPNPTIDDSKTTSIESGKISTTKVQPATNTTSAPMKKKAVKSRRKRTKPRTD